MNSKKSSQIDEELLSKIISAAYGNASLIDKFKINRLIRSDVQLRALYEEYRTTALAVRSLKREKFENNKVLITEKHNTKTMFDEIYSMFLGKPIIYSAIVTVLLVSILFSVFSNRNISYNGYTLAEVEKANRESRLAISIVTNIFNKTETVLKSDILYKKVSKPISEGMNTVNKLFNKETKQWKRNYY